MKIAGNRLINIILTAGIVLCAGVILYVFLIGDIDIRIGGVKGIRFVCKRMRNPSSVLFALILLKFILLRPHPLRRLKAWFGENARMLALGAVVLTAAALPRLYDLGGHSLVADETLWIDRGTEFFYPLRAHEFKKATLHLGHPGVTSAALIGSSYVYLGRGVSTLSWNLFQPLTAARFPIALTGIATCLLLYLIGRLTFGDAPAFWAAFFLALYPSHIALSRIAHVDCPLILFAMLSLLAYLTGVLRLSLRWKIVSAVFFGLALLTKTPAIFLPIVVIAWRFSVRLTEGRRGFRLFELSDLGWLGIGLTVFFCLFTKLWYPPHEIHWMDFAGYLPVVPVAAELVHLVAKFPWLQILVVILGIYCAFRILRGGADGLKARPDSAFRAVLAVLSCLAFIQVFSNPILQTMYLVSKAYHIGEIGHLKYWMGTVVTRPPLYFYPFMLLVVTPPLILILAIPGLARACGAIRRGEGVGMACLMCIVSSLLFAGIMSVGHKMAFRYIGPVIPFLCLMAGVGMAWIVDGLAGRVGSARIALKVLAFLLVLFALLPPLARVAPDYDLYHNFIVGGPSGAARMFSIGSGPGIKSAVQFLKNSAREDDAIYSLGTGPEFRYHWLHDEPHPTFNVVINRTVPPHVDWLLIPAAFRQRGINPEILKLAETTLKYHSVVRDGIDFLDIYRLDDRPVGGEVILQAEDLTVGLGEVVSDRGAGGGAAVRIRKKRGLVFSGPNTRFAPGRWKASFIMKVGDFAGEGELAVISVTDSSGRKIFSSKTITPGEFERPGSYREFTLEFGVDKPTRLSFCVETCVPVELSVDSVALIKMSPSEVFQPMGGGSNHEGHEEKQAL